MPLLRDLLRLFRRRRDTSVDVVAPGRARTAPPSDAPDSAAAWIDRLMARAIDEAPDVGEARVARLAERVAQRAHAGIPAIATFSGSARRILELRGRDDEDLNPLVRTLSQDAAVTAALLGVANSAASAPSAPISNVRDAVVRLGGAETIRIALAVAMRSMYANGAQDPRAALRTQLYVDSLGDAFTASWLAGVLRVPDAERVFVMTMVRELARPAALQLALDELGPDELADLQDHDLLALIDAAAPVVARALAPTLQLPDGLDQGLTAEPGSSPAWVHVARMCAALGALLRFAPRPGWWAAQAHSAAQQLELEGAAVRAAITQRAEDDRVAMTISGGRVRPMRELTRRVDRIARP